MTPRRLGRTHLEYLKGVVACGRGPVDVGRRPRRGRAKLRRPDRPALPSLPCRRFWASAHALRPRVQDERLHHAGHVLQRPDLGDGGGVLRPHTEGPVQSAGPALWRQRQLFPRPGKPVRRRRPGLAPGRLLSEHLRRRRQGVPLGQPRRPGRHERQARGQGHDPGSEPQQCADGPGRLQHPAGLGLSLHHLQSRADPRAPRP